jgi:Ca-activated chloride channel family protein
LSRHDETVILRGQRDARVTNDPRQMSSNDYQAREAIMLRRSLAILPIILLPLFGCNAEADKSAPASAEAQSSDDSPAATASPAPPAVDSDSAAAESEADPPDDRERGTGQRAKSPTAAPPAASASPMEEKSEREHARNRPSPFGGRPEADQPRATDAAPPPATVPDKKPGKAPADLFERGRQKAKSDAQKKAKVRRDLKERLQGRKGLVGNKRAEVTGGQEGEGRPVLSEGPSAMLFKHYGVNPTIDTEEEPRSTFAVDVDTASYAMARSFLERGVLPAEAAVRVEEIVNAFDYGYEAPHGKTFNIMAEAAPSPNRRGYHIMHIGVKGMEVSKDNRKAANLVFVIDVSGSMQPDNRLGLVKRSLRLLVDQLDESDKVGIVTYGSKAKEVLQPTSAWRRDDINAVIDGLKTEGATNAEAGLRVGYQMAERHFRPEAVNRVVLLSDGVANVGLTGPTSILETIQQQVKRGIKMTTVGFGMGNYNDVLMEQLADKGDGNYFYVDKLAQARKVFVENLTGTLQVIAKDVKIQVKFDQRSVARYRLIGYENRALTARQFSDDRVDAGEIGAGHAVTAVYEIKLREGSSAPIASVRVRFKQPSGGQSMLMQKTVPNHIVKNENGDLSSPSQLSLIAAQFGEKLRGSYWARNISYDDIVARFDKVSPGLRQQEQVIELRRLVEKARDLDIRGDKFVSQGPVARMDFDRVPVLR